MPDRTFRIVLRGYDPAEVDQHLQAVVGQLDTSHRQGEDAAAALRKQRTVSSTLMQELEVERQRVQQLQSELQSAESPTFLDLGARVGQILALAEQEANELRADGQRQGDQLRDAAREQADRMRNEARTYADQVRGRADAEVERRLLEANEQATDVLEGAEREAMVRREEAEVIYEQQRARAAAAATELEAAIAQRRERADDDFHRARAGHEQGLAEAQERLDAAKVEADELSASAARDAEQTVAAARAEAERLVRAARERSQRIRSESDRELAATSEQRAAINAQLTNVRQMLATIGGRAGDDESAADLSAAESLLAASASEEAPERPGTSTEEIPATTASDEEPEATTDSDEDTAVEPERAEDAAGQDDPASAQAESDTEGDAEESDEPAAAPARGGRRPQTSGARR